MMPKRKQLPDTRPSLTHRVRIETDQGALSVYIIVGFDAEGNVAEVFLNAGKIGSTVRGLLNDFARQLSFSLQFGVPLSELCERMTGSNYPPQGPTQNEAIPSCSSITDYLFRYLAELGKEEAS